jgi:DNA (cytosine-5)-methyltransferase 1
MVLCDRCNKDFANPSTLKRHLARKNPCVKYSVNEKKDVTVPNLNFIDIFCGVGGFHQALSKFGAKCVLACDIDKDCRIVYKDNYGIEPVPDVKKIDEKTIPDFDILCAGFPCFVAGTLVLTNSGYKNIEDVSLEDKLLTHTGKFQKILNLQSKSYTGKLYHISVKQVIICTEEHPFYVRKENAEPVWKKASEITNDYYFGMVKDMCSINENLGCFIEGKYIWFKLQNIKIEDTVNTPVYNFEVEEDNSYIVQNVIAHNCQAFSNGGKKKCFDDERGLLFDEIIRIASHKKPKFMFLENVKHILKVSDGKVIEYIKNKIEQTGYKLQLFQLSPHNYGIPQQRERVYFVCIRNDIYNGKDILFPPHKKCEDFTKFLDKNIDQKYYVKGDILEVLNAWDEMVKQFQVGEKLSPTIMIKEAYKNYTEKEFNDLPSWKREYITKNKPLIKKYEKQFRDWYEKHFSLLEKREIYNQLDWQTGVIKPDDSIFNHFIQIRQSGIRVKKGEYFPTLVAISQIPIYGKEKRFITPRECARLQSFPETFRLSTNDKITYKQMGNSVNVDNVYTVMSATFEKYFI